ncbi:MAG: glycosyltransferase family 4 protein [Pseudooceanicola nanhaiensis]|uniref:glycosyltransferase family 4 protein n=1 Tax=Pseudooceanicola nanhaiensis TaxID=375761 RepID=UPI004058A3AF
MSAAGPAPGKGRVVILNDSSIARGGATGLALMSARMLRARGHAVSFISGDTGDGGALAAEGIEALALGGRLLLDRKRIEAVRSGLYNRAMGQRIAAEIAARDTAQTVYHLHGWSRILSPAVFDALRPVAARTYVHAHDYFLACPNGIYFDYRRGEVCGRVPLSASCLGTNCDRRSYGHKLWRVLRQRALRRAFGPGAPWAGVISLGPWMTEPLARGGVPERLITPVGNPARAFTTERVRAEAAERFCYIGRTERGKGVRTLCEAARLAGVKLRVIGDTALQPDLPVAFPEVAFTGWVDQGDIGRHLADCRALVVPSRYPEPFGLVAAEASRSGLPVLISDVMPLAREVADRRLGLAVNSRSAEALADDLRRAAALPAAELRDISIRAFAAEDTFSLTPEAWMDRLEALYARAAGAG